MNTAIIIIAHGRPFEGGCKDPQEMLDRHLPVWERLNTPITVITPIDSKVKTTHPQVSRNKSARSGPVALSRVKLALELATQHDFSILTEADALCLCKEINWLPGFHATVQLNNLKRFAAEYYPIWPLMLDRQSAIALLDYSTAHPQITGGYHADRYLGELAHWGKIRLEPFNEPGFVMNTIEQHDHPHLKYFLDQGCCWIHGVKTEECFKFILDNWKDNPWKS